MNGILGIPESFGARPDVVPVGPLVFVAVRIPPVGLAQHAGAPTEVAKPAAVGLGAIHQFANPLPERLLRLFAQVDLHHLDNPFAGDDDVHAGGWAFVIGAQGAILLFHLDPIEAIASRVFLVPLIDIRAQLFKDGQPAGGDEDADVRAGKRENRAFILINCRL